MYLYTIYGTIINGTECRDKILPEKELQYYLYRPEHVQLYALSIGSNT